MSQTNDDDRRWDHLLKVDAEADSKPLWTAERLAAYLAEPRDPDDDLSDEEFAAWLADIYHGRRCNGCAECLESG